MNIQKTKRVSKNTSDSSSNLVVTKCKRKDILITKKIEKLIQKRQVEAVPLEFTIELCPQYQFYLSGEIVVDFDIFKDEPNGFKQNPSNLFKFLERMTKTKHHIEFETCSKSSMMGNFEIVVATINRVTHPRAREMAALLSDYQEKVSRRTKYALLLQEQQDLKGMKIDYNSRKEESFRNAQQILDSVCRDNPNSIYFFVIRRKGMFSIDVLKSGYSNTAIRLAGFSLEDFEQSILRDRCVPLKHQNNAWDYIKEKMYSNFHNKNYSNIQRKVTLKTGQVLNIFMTARTYPLNVNLSPDTNLLDLNDYLELILIEPFIPKVDRFAEANELVIQNQQQYIEQSKLFIEKFYSPEDLQKIGFVKNSGNSKNKNKKCNDDAKYIQGQETPENNQRDYSKHQSSSSLAQSGKTEELKDFSKPNNIQQILNKPDSKEDSDDGVSSIDFNRKEQIVNSESHQYAHQYYYNSLSTEDNLAQTETNPSESYYNHQQQQLFVRGEGFDTTGQQQEERENYLYSQNVYDKMEQNQQSYYYNNDIMADEKTDNIFSLSEKNEKDFENEESKLESYQKQQNMYYQEELYEPHHLNQSQTSNSSQMHLNSYQ